MHDPPSQTQPLQSAPPEVLLLLLLLPPPQAAPPSMVQIAWSQGWATKVASWSAVAPRPEQFWTQVLWFCAVSQPGPLHAR
jgi:hypothetical protein